MSTTVDVAMTVNALCVLCMRLVIRPYGQQVTSLQCGCSKKMYMIKRRLVNSDRKTERYKNEMKETSLFRKGGKEHSDV